MTTFQQIKFMASIVQDDKSVSEELITGITSDLFPGLAVHKSIGDQGNWSVSHIVSGFCLNPYYCRLCEILNAAISLSAICDWSQWKTVDEAKQGATPHKDKVMAVFHEGTTES